MYRVQYSRVEFFGDGRELLKSPNILSNRPKRDLKQGVLHLLIELGTRGSRKGLQELRREEG